MVNTFKSLSVFSFPSSSVLLASSTSLLTVRIPVSSRLTLRSQYFHSGCCYHSKSHLSSSSLFYKRISARSYSILRMISNTSSSNSLSSSSPLLSSISTTIAPSLPVSTLSPALSFLSSLGTDISLASRRFTTSFPEPPSLSRKEKRANRIQVGAVEPDPVEEITEGHEIPETFKSDVTSSISLHPAARALPNEPQPNTTHISKVVFLGTCSAIPNVRRNTSSLAVMLSNGSTILVDCGEATQLQIMRSRSVNFNKIDVICITHMHGDHNFGLFGLLCTALNASERTTPLKIIGPPILEHVVKTVLSATTQLPLHNIEFISLTENVPHDLGEICGIHLRAYPIPHTIPAFAFHLREFDQAGALLVNEAIKAGIRGSQIGKLKLEGFAYTTTGERISSAGLVGPPQKGRSFAVIQDTYDPSHLVEALANCDVLIHECTYGRAYWQSALEYGHSTSIVAGKFAALVNAKLLILTHFSQRYARRGKDTPENATTIEDLVKEALVAYTSLAKYGPRDGVYAAEDFMAFEHKDGALRYAGSDLNNSNVPYPIELGPIRMKVNAELVEEHAKQ